MKIRNTMILFLLIITISLFGCTKESTFIDEEKSINQKINNTINVKDANTIINSNADFINNYNIISYSSGNIYINDVKLWTGYDINENKKFLYRNNILNDNYNEVMNENNYMLLKTNLNNGKDRYQIKHNSNIYYADSFGRQKSFFFNGEYIAYHKCSKTIYNPNVNENDCLPDQIYINNMLIDSTDMDNIFNDKKYLFRIKYFKDNILIYRKDDKYFIYNIKDKSKKEYKELKNIVSGIFENKDLRYNIEIIGFINDKIVLKVLTDNMYNDYLYNKISEQLNTNGYDLDDKNIYEESGYKYGILNKDDIKKNLGDPWSDEPIESFKNYGVAPIKGLHTLFYEKTFYFYDIYLGDKKIVNHTIESKVFDNNLYYIKIQDLNFEYLNPIYFPNNTEEFPLSYKLKDKIQSYYRYKIYKNESKIGEFDYKNTHNFVYIPKLINSEDGSCEIYKELDYLQGNICIYKNNYFTITANIKKDFLENIWGYKGTGDNIIDNYVYIYNGTKININVNELSLDMINNMENIQQIGDKILINKIYPIFNENGLNKLIIDAVDINKNKFDFYKSSSKEGDMYEFISKNIGVTESKLKELNSMDRENLNLENQKIYQKFTNFMENLEKGYKIYEMKYNNGFIATPKLMTKSYESILGINKK